MDIVLVCYLASIRSLSYKKLLDVHLRLLNNGCITMLVKDQVHSGFRKGLDIDEKKGL